MIVLFIKQNKTIINLDGDRRESKQTVWKKLRRSSRLDPLPVEI